MDLDKALSEFLIHLRINESKAVKTIISYEDDLTQYVSWLKQEDIHEVEEISEQAIQSFIIEQNTYKASSSVVRMASSIRSFHHDYSFLHDTEDPSLNIEVHKNTKRLPVFCTVEEITRLMHSFDDTDPKQMLDHAILEMIYSCGLRVSEAVSLTLNRVNLDTGTLRVLGKGNKERIVPIPRGSLSFFKEYRDSIRPALLKKKSSLFFINIYGRKVTVKYVEELLQKKCTELNFEKHITPHKLRHSYATHMLQGGADLRSIQEILGHANIETTEIYTHVQNQQVIDAYNRYHPGGNETLLGDLHILKKN